MMPLIYHSTTYLLVFFVVLAAWGAFEGFGPLRWYGAKEATKDHSSSVVLWSAYLFGIACYFLWPIWFPSTTITTNQVVVFYLGIILLFFGSWVRWWSIKTLGKYFTTTISVDTDHTVVDHGPYRFVRHPSYTGLIIMTLGLGLLITNWASVCTLVIVFLAGLWYRIKTEENLLTAILGAPYIEYCQRVPKRLIPFVV